jgi:hypothetical protein
LRRKDSRKRQILQNLKEMSNKKTNYAQVCNIAQHCAFEKDVLTSYIRELRCMFHLEKSVEL